MLIEIRRYTIVPGRRAEFVAWFRSEVVPVMEEVGMRVLGSFEAVDDPDGFLYMRQFVDEEERDRQLGRLTEHPAWEQRLKPTALAMEVDFRVELYRSGPGAG